MSSIQTAPSVSVVIPAHNPRPDYLAQTLAALRLQTLPSSRWELLLIDNASNPGLSAELVTFHPHGRLVREERLGLTAARLCGLHEAKAGLIVWVDDDNVLATDYLACATQAFAAHPTLGAAGGKSLPVYESPPPAWYRPDLAPIGCRDLGEQAQWAAWGPTAERNYPTSAPIGAGLVIRREAMSAWAQIAQTDARRQGLGRTGTALNSGEDNDINLTLLAAGWQLAYLPELLLHHLIPAVRLTASYQERIAHATFRDFTRVLQLHGICPWAPIARWTLPLRKAKTWLGFRAWSSPAARIRWAGACGQFEARASIDRRF